ncbi:hypothetical protein [Blastococcus tunisiensis]|uniref:hypothetical protein n=1 Tax=Blastococcus tunisiensis TaxID=1798228 RepID=UPI00111331B2|nr:hypothetical protein [Blastococcus sp. DSM 46838]
MTWVLAALAVWLVLSFGAAVVIGRSIRLADRRAPRVTADAVHSPADLAPAPQAVAARVRRRVVPVPPVGIALFAIALGLETVGYVTRLTGATGQTAQLLSMDAPWSLPRLFVAALFAAAALAAVAGAGSIPGRRTWWVAVGLVAGTVAAVKAGSTVHSDALRSLEVQLGSTGALAVSALAAAAVVGGLWFLSRTERRDRRRVLGVLSLYAVASVGLSAVSSVVAGAYGAASKLAAAATFLEESGEALAGVSFLVAVLVGVAPRVVLPAAWALRRSADAHTLELPEALPTRAEGSARS